MKNSNYILVYLSALIIGIILICVNSRESLYHGMVIAIGVLFLVPSAVMLISSFVSRKDKTTGLKISKPWYTALVAVAGLLFGIWLLSMPGFFIGAAVYTLGVILILVGFAQVVFIYVGVRKADMNAWWYVIPWLCIAGGFIIIFIGPVKMGYAANIVAGILLIFYAFNGFFSLAKANLQRRRIERQEKSIAQRSDNRLE